MFCGNPGCDNEVHEGAGTSHYRIPEEEGMTNRPKYCCALCAIYVRNSNYLSGSIPVMVIDGEVHVLRPD